MFARLKAGLARTRSNLSDALGDLLRGKKQIDDELLEDLETLLLTADVGVEATRRVIDDLTARVSRRELADPDALGEVLRGQLAELLRSIDKPVIESPPGRPQVVLMVGINGAGKTTTIGKLARRFKDDGNSVMLAAGDTFRAAAVEQLQAWGTRTAHCLTGYQSHHVNPIIGSTRVEDGDLGDQRPAISYQLSARCSG